MMSGSLGLAVGAGRGVDRWVWAKGALCGRYSGSAVQGGEGVRRVAASLVQGEEGEASILEPCFAM